MSRRKKRTDKFKSEFEAKLHKIIKPMCDSARAFVSYESEKLPYVIYSDYTPDFVVEFSDGRKMYIEAKGYLDYEARAKMQAVKKQHPDLDIRFIFVRNNKLNKRAKMTYCDWADKYGFPWAIGSLPEEWLYE